MPSVRRKAALWLAKNWTLKGIVERTVVDFVRQDTTGADMYAANVDHPAIIDVLCASENLSAHSLHTLAGQLAERTQHLTAQTDSNEHTSIEVRRDEAERILANVSRLTRRYTFDDTTRKLLLEAVNPAFGTLLAAQRHDVWRHVRTRLADSETFQAVLDEATTSDNPQRLAELADTNQDRLVQRAIVYNRHTDAATILRILAQRKHLRMHEVFAAQKGRWDVLVCLWEQFTTRVHDTEWLPPAGHRDVDRIVTKIVRSTVASGAAKERILAALAKDGYPIGEWALQLPLWPRHNPAITTVIAGELCEKLDATDVDVTVIAKLAGDFDGTIGDLLDAGQLLNT